MVELNNPSSPESIDNRKGNERMKIYECQKRRVARAVPGRGCRNHLSVDRL